MQLHEKRPVKRAGVAGIALRAEGEYQDIFLCRDRGGIQSNY
ncbi:hypothetical protein ACSILP_003699 [Yersinia enterocolitica]